MAIYVPPSRRRTRRVLEAVALVAVGAMVGFFSGRATAPTLVAQVRDAREQGRALAAGLRVVALHEEANAASGTASTESVLERTASGLTAAFADAPWIPASERSRIADDVATLRRTQTEGELGPRADAVAAEIERAFGITPPSRGP